MPDITLDDIVYKSEGRRGRPAVLFTFEPCSQGHCAHCGFSVEHDVEGSDALDWQCDHECHVPPPFCCPSCGNAEAENFVLWEWEPCGRRLLSIGPDHHLVVDAGVARYGDGDSAGGDEYGPTWMCGSCSHSFRHHEGWLIDYA